MSGLIKTSIIIPTYNSLKNLAFIHKSLRKQKNINFSNIEILIVQNNKDYFLEVTPKFLKKNNLEYKIIYESKLGLHHARNKGVKSAKSNNLILLDDDVILENNHLSNMIRSLKNYNLVGGPNLIDQKIKILNWIKKYYFKKISENQFYCNYLSYLDLGEENKIIDPTYIYGMNMGFKKNLFYKYNGFHPDLIGKGYDNFFIGDGETGFLNKCKINKIKAFYNVNCKVHHKITKKRNSLPFFIERSKYHAIGESFATLKKNSNKFHALLRIVKLIIKLIFIEYTYKKKNTNMFIRYKLPVDKIRYKYIIKHHLYYIFNSKINEWVKRKDYFKT